MKVRCHPGTMWDDVDAGCGSLMRHGQSVAFRHSAFHAVFLRQNAFSAMKRREESSKTTKKLTPGSVVGRKDD